MRLTFPALLLATTASALGAQQKRPITYEDFAAVRAVSDPQISPDGRSVVYAVRTTDIAANRRAGKTYVVPITGGTPRVFPADDVSASEARWSPDGRRIAYITAGQLWVADVDGGNRVQLTKLAGGAT